MGYAKGSRLGKKSNCWKGGVKRGNGYIFLYTPHHPYAKKYYVLEHRLIMEKTLGRFLNPNELVHHINGIMDDNRIKNLVLITRPEHISLHHKGKHTRRDKNGKFTYGKI